MRYRLLLAGAVAAVLVAYAVVAGVFGARFVTPAECARVASSGSSGELEISYGHYADLATAESVVQRAQAIGYVDAMAVADGCGRWKAINPQVDSYEGGSDAVAEGERAGLPGRLEVASG